MANVMVVPRFRPLNKRELSESNGANVVVDFEDERTFTINEHGKPHRFTFDRVFPPTCRQVEMFEYIGIPILADVFQGYNATIFAYGQTGSGKTHSMMGDMNDDEQKGIIPRVVEAIFTGISQSDAAICFTVKASYVEIYNEKIRDLLDTTKSNLKVRESSTGVWIEDVTQTYVTCTDDIYRVMAEGSDNRAMSSTQMNAVSSRSHSVFIITVGQEDTSTGTKRGAKLTLVDLAGSEKVGKTGAEGERLKEAQHINKSLSALGNVINALTSAPPPPPKGSKAAPVKTHIPYRDSKLTYLLSDSLGGNSKTALIITGSPSEFNLEETINTIRFGNRAKNIKNKPKQNQERSAAEYQRLLNSANAKISAQEAVIAALEGEVTAFRRCLSRGDPIILPAPLAALYMAAVARVARDTDGHPEWAKYLLSEEAERAAAKAAGLALATGAGADGKSSNSMSIFTPRPPSPSDAPTEAGDDADGDVDKETLGEGIAHFLAAADADDADAAAAAAAAGADGKGTLSPVEPEDDDVPAAGATTTAEAAAAAKEEAEAKAGDAAPEDDNDEEDDENPVSPWAHDGDDDDEDEDDAADEAGEDISDLPSGSASAPASGLRRKKGAASSSGSALTLARNTRDLVSVNDALEADLEAARAEVGAARRELDEARRAAAAASAETASKIEELTAAVAAATIAKDDAERRVHEEEEKARLRDKKQSLVDSERTTELEEARRDGEETRARVLALKASLAEAEEERAHLDAARAEADERAAKSEAVLRKLKELHGDEWVDEVAAELAAADGNAAAAAASSGAAAGGSKMSPAQAAAAIRTLKDQNSSFRAALARKCEQYVGAQTALLAYKEHVETLEASLEDARAGADASVGEIQSLRETLAATEKLCKQLLDSGRYWRSQGVYSRFTRAGASPAPAQGAGGRIVVPMHGGGNVTPAPVRGGSNVIRPAAATGGVAQTGGSVATPQQPHSVAGKGTQSSFSRFF